MAKKSPMSMPLRVGLYIGVSLLGLALIAATVYIITGASSDDPETNPDNGTVVDEQTAIQAALQQLEDTMLDTPIAIQVDDRQFQLEPESVGFDLDEQAVLERLLQTGEEQPSAQQIQDLIGGDPTALPTLQLTGSVNERALTRLLNEYEEQALEIPFEGLIILEDGTPVAEYPRPGQTIEYPPAIDRITSALLEYPRGDPLVLPVVDKAPALTVADVAEALAQAQTMLSGPITLTVQTVGEPASDEPPRQLTLEQQLLIDAFFSQIETDPVTRMVLGFDPAFFVVPLEPLRSEFEDPPVNASVTTDEDDNVVVVEGSPGTLLSPELTAQAAAEAARMVDRTSELRVELGVDPEVTTEDIVALGIKEKLSEATTEHRCCQSRVTNIHLFADAMDHTIVLPGETLSLNDTVGERTLEKGYLPAPTIIRGRLEDTVGGGVSQFATTFYNAVFDAGMEDIEHRPHSYYFSRYPEGIEATISWREPDLIFRNNTEAAVLIRTQYTDTSITVKFFGDNGGIEVNRWKSARYAPTEPATEYLTNPELLPSEGEVEVVEGRAGWSVTVGRVITFPDGTTEEEEWRVRYRARPREVEVHPCLLPEDHEEYTGEECPPEESTTSTSEPDTSSTTQPEDGPSTTTSTTQPDTSSTTQPETTDTTFPAGSEG